MEPVSLLALIAAITQLLEQGNRGRKAMIELFSTEFGSFWEEFERLLRDKDHVPFVDVDGQCYQDPEFKVLVLSLIGGDAEARAELEKRFETFLEPDAVASVLQAADEAANRAADDDRKAEFASREFILGAIERSRAEVVAAIRTVGEQVDETKSAVEETRGAVEETKTSVEELTTSVAEGVGLSSETEDRIRKIVHEKTAKSAPSETRAIGVNADELEELLEKKNEAVLSEIQKLMGSGGSVFDDLASAPQTKPSLESPASGTAEEHVEELRKEDPGSAERLDALMDHGPMGVVRALRAGELNDGPVPLLVAASRIVSLEGFYAEAEEAYLRAADLCQDDTEKARQFVRAIRMADAQDDDVRRVAYLERARDLAPKLPALAIVEARAVHDPAAVLSMLEGVEGENDDERAAIHQTRAQAHLALGDEDEAREELARAQSANRDHISVREFEAILPWYSAQLQISRGEVPAKEPLRGAAKRFLELSDEVALQGRASESAQVRARAAEAWMLAGDHERAQEILQGISGEGRLSLEARVALGRAAMICQRADLVLRFVPDEASDDDAVLVRAEAQAIAGSARERRLAEPTLRRLLSHDEEDIRRQAAFALLVIATSERDIDWDKEAAEIVRSAKPETEAALRAERLFLEGKADEAEAVLLPYAGRVQTLRRLRDYAGVAGNWEKVEDRSRALVQIDDDPTDRLALADALRHLGKREEASKQFFALARDTGIPTEVRESAFAGAMDTSIEPRQYEDVRELAEEWHSALPESDNALWNRAFALARLSRHDEALELLSHLPIDRLNEQRATLLAEILHRAAPADEALRRLIEISDQFDRKLEAIEGLVIATSLKVEREGELDEAIVMRLRDTYETFEERFPDSTAIQMVPAPRTAEEFEQLTQEMLGDRPKLQADALDAITRGRGPVNALAAVSPGGVGATWARLYHPPLSLGLDDLNAADLADAKDALGGGAVWDSSSLFIVQGVDQDLRKVILASLPGSRIVTETLEDADGDMVMGGRGQAETVHDAQGHFGIREIPEEERDAEARRIRETLALAKGFSVESAEGPVDDDKLLELYAGEQPAEIKAVVGSVMLAKRTGRPLYSDDRWIRLLARDREVATFGTLALLEAIQEQSVITSDVFRLSRRELAARGAWGVSLTGEEMIEEGIAAEFDLTPGLIGGFHDRAAWRGQPAQTCGAIVTFLAAVFDAKPELVRNWVRRAVDAGHVVTPEAGLSWFADTLLLMAWGLGTKTSTISNNAFQAIVDEVKSLPPGLREPGHDPVLSSMAQMLSLADSWTPQERTQLFGLLLRRLRLGDQLRAMKTFVEGF